MNDDGPFPQMRQGPSFFRGRGWWIAAVVLTLFAAGGVIATLLVQRYITFPNPPPTAFQPESRARAHGEQIWLDVDGDRVEAWFLPAATSAPAPLVIYAHGNGELIDMRAQEFDGLRAGGVHALLVEFPGYGRSQGSPSEASVTEALVAAYDWAARDPRVDARRIVGHGRSLGGGAIAQLAARRTLAALILESTFENLGEFIMGYGVPRVLLLNTFDTRAVLTHYAGPVLVLHGTQDRIFASRQAELLAKAARHATLHLSTCGHNDCPRHWDLILGFLAQNGVSSSPMNAGLIPAVTTGAPP
jgi:fermentation-respiration switch protein FrsA (DUF1100 family)